MTKPTPTVLDYAVTVSRGGGLDWAVFDAVSGDDLVTGHSTTSAGAVNAARAAIAARTITVARTPGGWSIMHPVHGIIVPLPLTPAASEDAVRAHVLALPIGAAAGRVVVMGAL